MENVLNLKFGRQLGLFAIVVISIVSGLAVSGLLTTSRTLSSSGTVKSINVEVFWDLECTQVVSSVDWGIPGPGELVSRNVFLKNAGSAPMNVTLSTSDWVPSEALNYLVLSWDQEGVQIDTGAVVPAVLALNISDSITGITDFSFNIIIEGFG